MSRIATILPMRIKLLEKTWSFQNAPNWRLRWVQKKETFKNKKLGKNESCCGRVFFSTCHVFFLWVGFFGSFDSTFRNHPVFVEAYLQNSPKQGSKRGGASFEAILVAYWLCCEYWVLFLPFSELTRSGFCFGEAFATLAKTPSLRLS